MRDDRRVNERAWIVLDLIVHHAWDIGDQDPELADAWSRLRQALSVPPHQLVSWSNSGQQALLYAVSTDLDAFLEIARRHAPSQGVASFVAKVWGADPRQSDAPPREIELLRPHPAWPKPGYGEDVARVLAESQVSEQPRRRQRDFEKLVAQYSESVHRLAFELTASNAPFEREQLRSLAQGTVLSLGALRRAAPIELAPLIEEAEALLSRVTDALN